jgi:hypothetical protein
MSYFVKQGNSFRVAAKEAMELYTELPVGNYVVKQDPYENLYLEMIDSFTFKGKRYGDLVKNTDRILRTFMSRPATTGVMLAGEKGSGKSLLAKNIAMKAAEQGMPTIVINQAWHGDKFNTFMQTISQPCVILFDEFEKVYDREEQESILTLLDGVFSSKKLFVLTCNDKYRIDTHMRNRPGRIYYLLDFKGLDTDFIVEYCEDNLQHKEHTAAICKIVTLFNEFNFDMLQALIEEINRYNESPQEAMKMLNAKPEFEEFSMFDVKLLVNGVEIPADKLERRQWRGNPLAKPIAFEYASDDSEWKICNFMQADLQVLDPIQGKFVFKNADSEQLVLTRVKPTIVDYFSLV